MGDISASLRLSGKLLISTHLLNYFEEKGQKLYNFVEVFLKACYQSVKLILGSVS